MTRRLILLFAIAVVAFGCPGEPDKPKVGKSKSKLVAEAADGGIGDGSIGSWTQHPVKIEEFHQGEDCYDEAIDRAFQAADSRDGFVILFGPGDYCFDEPVFIQDGFHLHGSGRDSTKLIFAVDQSGLVVAGQGDIASYGADAGLSGYTGSVIKKVVIRDLTVVGNGNATPSSGSTAADGIVVNGKASLTNVRVEKFERDGIHVGGAAFGSDDEFSFYSQYNDVHVQNNGRAGIWIEDSNLIGSHVFVNVQASSNGDSSGWAAADRAGIVNENDSGDFTWIGCGSESNYNSQNWVGCQSCRDVFINPYSEGATGQKYGNQAVIIGGAAAAASPGNGASNRPTLLKRGKVEHTGLHFETQNLPDSSGPTLNVKVAPPENDILVKAYTDSDGDRDLNLLKWDSSDSTYMCEYEGDDGQVAFKITTKQNSTNVDDGMMWFPDGFLMGDGALGTSTMRIDECGTSVARPAAGDCAVHDRGDVCRVNLPDTTLSACTVCGAYSHCTEWVCVKSGASSYTWECAAGL